MKCSGNCSEGERQIGSAWRDNFLTVHYSVLLTQFSSGDKIEKNEMGAACSAYRGEETHIQCLVGKPEGKRPLWRPRRRWEENINMDL